MRTKLKGDVRMSEKYQYFNGLKFTRDEEKGYYLNSTIRERLHRYVWKFYNGEIPEGSQIHHKDGDKSNNDILNLEIKTKSKHMALHMTERTKNDPQGFIDRMNYAREFASAWHGSEEGKAWHKKHFEEVKEALYKRGEYVCEFCGKNFETTISKANRFCSNKCKSAWRRQSGVDNETRTCKQCGKEFITNKYSSAETCSQSCANSYRINSERWQARRLQHGSEKTS